MFVNLISHTNNIDVLDKVAAICVDKYDTASYVNFNAAIASGHISVLEHVTLTFYVEGVSRALTHQLVRHRLASYAEQSQRYSKIDVEKVISFSFLWVCSLLTKVKSIQLRI